MLKKAQVIMLPTNQKPVKGTLLFRNAFGEKTLWQYKETYTYTDGTEVYRTLGGSFEDWSVGMKPQHLHVVTDEKIREKDWVIDKYNQIWQFLNGSLIGHDVHGIKRFSTDNVEGHECRRIVASTDKALKLPEPSKSFIQKYVESFRNNIITNILVEYETIVTGQCDCICHKPGNVVMHMMACCHPKHSDVVKVDTKNNTITIKKQKDSFTREEHSLNLMNCVSELAAQFGHTPNASEMKKWNDATNDWIYENL